jgi:hypothetical protein
LILLQILIFKSTVYPLDSMKRAVSMPTPWAHLAWERVYFTNGSLSEVAQCCSKPEALSSKDGLSILTEQADRKTVYHCGSHQLVLK